MKPEQAQDEEDDDDKTDEIDDAFHGRASFALRDGMCEFELTPFRKR
jgi:hypothetical protein